MEDSGLTDLWARAARGDPRALEELLRAVRPKIFRYALARTGEKEVADDVAQETCLAMLTSLNRFEDRGGPVLAYVLGIAHNKISMTYRSRSRHPAAFGASIPEQVDPAAGPEETVVRNATVAKVRELLAGLPDRQRSLLLLRLAAGLSAEETAAVLGMTAGAVRVAQHRALELLRTRGVTLAAWR